jgi:hypothetical protein
MVMIKVAIITNFSLVIWIFLLELFINTDATLISMQ